MDTELEVTPVADDVTPEEAATIPSPEADKTEDETPTTEPEEGTQEEGEEDELEKLLGKPEEGEAELLDIEYEGKSYKLPPELKDALLRQSDYTKKTMDLAEQRKATEAEREQLETFRNLSNERMQAVQNVMEIDARIKQIEETPVDGLSQDQINSYRMDLQDLKNQRTQWASFGQEVAKREEAEQRQQFAKAVEMASSAAAKSIPNFTERKSQLAEYISARGGDPAMVNEIADPVVWQVLDDADIGRRYRERQAKAKTIKDAAVVKPAPQVGGKASARKDPNTMSPEEYHAMRVKQRSGL